MRYSLRQMEVFAWIARTGSVSRAAEALALSQSAASTALAELERQFDTPLFDRVGKSLHLNEMGARLLPRAVELLDRAGEIEDLLTGHEGFGQLRIGATLTIGNYLGTVIVARFLQAHPEARVDLEVRNMSTIVQRVAHFDLDLGLIEGSCQHPDLVVSPWVADELAVFAAPDHPLASKRHVSLDALAQEPWIVREKGSATRETFDHAFRHFQGRLNVRLQLEHTEAIKRAVESGFGIGCISRLALREAFRRGSLVPIHTPDLDLRRQFNFLWHRQKFQTASIRSFLALCREVTGKAKRSDEIALPFIP